MNTSLNTLCRTLKHIFTQFKPHLQPMSFLILTGRGNQGKSTLMRQANFDHHPIDAEGAHIYTNQHGIIVELGETWLNQTEHLLEHTVKQLNSIHKNIKINGILLCVDINELLTANHSDINALIKTHAKLLERFGLCMNGPLDAAIIFTKLDLISGFCDFFQSEHPLDLAKPMGFSVEDATQPYRPIEQFKLKFDALIMSLGLQVTNKVHPIRSNIKRTLIREFPLQIASLRNLILPLIGSISSQLFRLQALYFISSEQGGIIQDRLNKKIQHEFALMIPEQLPLSTNYRAYFVEGALYAFQQATKRSIPKTNPKQIRVILGLSLASVCSISFFIYQYHSSTTILNQVRKELQVIKRLDNHYQSEAAVYHLAQASESLAALSKSTLDLPMIKLLQTKLQQHTSQQLTNSFIPNILHEVDAAINETEASLLSRYQALKIYLMLADKHHYNQEEVIAWFTQRWQSDPNRITKKLTWLEQVLQDKAHPIVINQTIVSDARNYLNAFPANYLYYALAKTQFNPKTTPIAFPGFTLANSSVPFYVTESGFLQTLAMLPKIAQKLTAENWVLARQDVHELPKILEDAYCSDYVFWWQHFMTNTHPERIESYSDVNRLTKTIRQTNTIAKLILLIQTNTKPQTGSKFNLYNYAIASKFSAINLLSPTNLQHLNASINELEQFSKTLTLVTDQGKTAFTITKARFQGDKLANPISLLYKEAQQFPDPLATWTTQIANDTWYTLINDSRAYINQAWQDLVFKEYQKHIAHRFPLDIKQSREIALVDFNRFFAKHGSLNRFLEEYVKPFLDTRHAQWLRKEVDHYVLPIADDTISELIRANVITHMFFTNSNEKTHIEFTLQKISLDPVVSQLQLTLGTIQLMDNQNSESVTTFKWPQSNARLIVRSIEGKQFELDEFGQWAFFKLLQKVNVLVDEQDSATLQILFEINGNTGRYLLKAQNQINPFIPGILDKFTLLDKIV